MRARSTPGSFAGVGTEAVAAPEPGRGDDVASLLDRMRAGDREAAAAFVDRFEPQLRRRIRGKLNPAMRRLFDSQEIISTLGRRLDLYVRERRVEAGTTDQLWALVMRMATNAVVDKARIFARLQLIEDEDGGFARALSGRLRDAEQRQEAGAEIEIERALQALDDRIDRQILSCWLSGDAHTDTAEVVGLAPAAVRHRWRRIKERLHDRFAGELTR